MIINILLIKPRKCIEYYSKITSNLRAITWELNSNTY